MPILLHEMPVDMVGLIFSGVQSESRGIMSSGPDDLNRLLAGGSVAPLPDLMGAAYNELRRIAGQFFRRERPDHTLQPTALVNEAFLRLSQSELPAFQSRAHFFGILARTMRCVLLDHARAHNAQRAGGLFVKLPIEGLDFAHSESPDALVLTDVIERLEAFDAHLARVFDLHILCGFSSDEIAEMLSCSSAKVRKDSQFARAWIKRALEGTSGSTGFRANSSAF
jgi:RNA polymerase sigma-70 factor (ECF subfamily)